MARIEPAPETTAGLWFGGAVAAYTLPGVVGALMFSRRGACRARRLLLADNVVRGVFLGAYRRPGFPLLTLPLSVVLGVAASCSPDATDQESRSTDHRAISSMTAMDVTIYAKTRNTRCRRSSKAAAR
jgi:hypothetical protein